MNVDCVAETSGCLLKFNFTAASGSPDCSCHHGVLKKKATPRIELHCSAAVARCEHAAGVALAGDVGCSCPWSQQLCGEEAGGCPLGSGAGPAQEGAARARGASGQRWRVRRLSSLRGREPKLRVLGAAEACLVLL